LRAGDVDVIEVVDGLWKMMGVVVMALSFSEKLYTTVA
jgi:hypothetical protein